MYTRRQFIKQAYCTVFASALLPQFFIKNSLATPSSPAPFVQTELHLGSIVTITCSQVSKNQAEEALAKGFEEIARLENIFSCHSKNSLLFELNSTGILKHAPQELITVLLKTQEVSQLTSNMYNPTVKALIDLFEKHKNPEGEMRHIDTQELEEAISLADMSALSVSSTAVQLKKYGMGITLDSIAKGYIIDKVSQVLTENNVPNHIINAGGDIYAKGQRNKNTPWTVGIEDPLNPQHALQTFNLKNAAIATSGSYQHNYDKRRKHHHIINPYDASSPAMLSLTVQAQSAMEADAFSTAFSLLDAKQSNELLSVLTNQQIYLI